MSIAEFIRERVMRPRLEESGCLVIYDDHRRYRSLCQSMESDKFRVIDASESSIESRELAIKGLVELGKGLIEGLIIYVPAHVPLTDEAKQVDPFSAIAACGDVFPHSDSDSFESICLKAKPDQSTAIRQIFAADPHASFSVIDAIGGGQGWPQLRSLLGVDSGRDSLLALLEPNAAQELALKGSDAWSQEAHDLLKTTLGLTLKTKGKTWSPIADELWRFLLFSEFAFDLPGTLPACLSDIPRADNAARPIVEGLCEDLRNDRRFQPKYIERAEAIEAELALAEQCKGIKDLGVKDTFPFEERTFLTHTIAAYLRDDIDTVRQILDQHQRSVWTGKGESRAQWDLMRAALELTLRCEDLERQLADHTKSMESILAFYAVSLRDMDRLHREFEQNLADYEWQDTKGVMTPVKVQARKHYGKLAEKVQLVFTRHVQSTGWPLPGHLANADVFDRVVAPRLQQNGHKVAYFLIDALRYELGVALEKQLSEDGAVELTAALAQLPSITSVGMVSLLPNAGQSLSFSLSGGGLVTQLNGQPITTVAQRMETFRKRYGQRFAEGRLEEFVRKGFEVGPDVDLLVLRAVEIDSHFENNPDTAPTEITNALKRIRMAIHKLIERGFHEVVIATDHGFFMNTHAGAGDTCPKPAGNWLVIHDRCLVGDGQADANHYLMAAEKLGMRGDVPKLAGPLSLAAYTNGLLYYHGGLSLQECVVPVIVVKLHKDQQPAVDQATVSLTYKNGAKRITTRVPVIDLAVDAGNMFSTGSAFEILLEAHNSKGEVIGEAKIGGLVNSATGTLSLRAGEKVQVTMKMQMEFEGKFKVKALNPKTNATYAQIDLETDYTV